MERVLAGLQQRRVVTEKEKRILAYHEAGHALVAHLMGDLMPVQKVTIVARGDALGYAYYLPREDRYLHTKEELLDVMKVALGGRAAEEIVFGRVTNGAANDLEKVTQIARSMVFEFGMSEVAASRTMRADNYALSEETKRMRDAEQARLTDLAYEEARACSSSIASRSTASPHALLEKETLERDELHELLGDVGPSRARPRPSAPSASSRVPARCHFARGAGLRARSGLHRGRWSPAASITSASQSHDLDAALDTYTRLLGAELEHRGRCPTRASRRPPSSSAAAASSCLPPLGDDTPSAASSPSAGQACTTSPTRSTTSRPRSASSRPRAPS